MTAFVFCKEADMHRRNMLWVTFSALGAVVAAASAQATSETNAGGRPRVIYHLSDLDKVAFVLGNIQNHLDGGGGPDRVTIALVVHGPASWVFHASGATPEVGQFSKSGLQVRPRARRLRQHHEGAACRSEGFAAPI